MASRYDELYFYIDVVSLHRDSRNDTLKIIYLRDVYPINEARLSIYRDSFPISRVAMML